MASLVIIFPGQGAQKVGMGSSFFSHPLFQQHLETAQAQLDFPLLNLLEQGPAEALLPTEIAQPLLFVVCSGIYKVWQAASGLTPLAIAGHSLGEYTALYAAGVLSFEASLELVKLRARLMQMACEQRPGAMAAILNPELESVRALCEQQAELVIANFNSPQQVVISGPAEAVTQASQQIRAAKWGRPLPLKVSGAFHSPLMQSAEQPLRAAIAATNFADSKVPVVMNASAEALSQGQQIQQVLQQQLLSPVYWQASVLSLGRFQPQLYLEIGARVLNGLIRQTASEAHIQALQTLEEIPEVLVHV